MLQASLKIKGFIYVEVQPVLSSKLINRSDHFGKEIGFLIQLQRTSEISEISDHLSILRKAEKRFRRYQLPSNPRSTPPACPKIQRAAS